MEVSLKVVYVAYFFAILSVPELVIGRLLLCLTHMAKRNVASLNNGHITFRAFCNNVDTIRQAFYHLAEVLLSTNSNCIYVGGYKLPFSWAKPRSLETT